MPLSVQRRSKKAGMAPGSLILVGERRTGKVRMSLMDYDESRLMERELASIEESFPLKDEPGVTWINIDGIHDIELLEKIGHHFGIHPLTLEDILNTGQRPKYEDFDSYLFIVFKMLSYDEEKERILAEQVSLILGKNFIISFQEKPGDIFDPVRERIRKGKGLVRKYGAGYLAYALIDSVVDHYFGILETVGERIERIEEKLLDDPRPKLLEDIHELKREMIFFRKQAWPMREIVSNLMRGDSPLVHESTGIFYSDIHDHGMQVIDTIESYRDVLSGMLDLYLSTASNRMNEVMKMLTVIATIFIPLTFLAGIYGMNFKFMPELEWKWGYFALWAVMIALALVMLAYFRRKKWL